MLVILGLCQVLGQPGLNSLPKLSGNQFEGALQTWRTPQNAKVKATQRARARRACSRHINYLLQPKSLLSKGCFTSKTPSTTLRTSDVDALVQRSSSLPPVKCIIQKTIQNWSSAYSFIDLAEFLVCNEPAVYRCQPQNDPVQFLCKIQKTRN